MTNSVSYLKLSRKCPFCGAGFASEKVGITLLAYHITKQHMGDNEWPILTRVTTWNTVPSVMRNLTARNHTGVFVNDWSRVLRNGRGRDYDSWSTTGDNLMVTVHKTKAKDRFLYINLLDFKNEDEQNVYFLKIQDMIKDMQTKVRVY